MFQIAFLCALGFVRGIFVLFLFERWTGILGGAQLILWSKVESSNLKNVECGIYEAQITDFDFTPCLMPKGVYDVNIL